MTLEQVIGLFLLGFYQDVRVGATEDQFEDF